MCLLVFAFVTDKLDCHCKYFQYRVLAETLRLQYFLSIANVIEGHKRMIELYQKAEDDIIKNGETDELILSLAREFLNENSAWYFYQQKNSANIVI